MTRDQRSQWLIYGLLLLMAAGTVYWYMNLEWEEKEIDLGPGIEAIRNPYLALEKFLETKGIDTDFQRGFSGLQNLTVKNTALGENDTLVLINSYQGLYPSHVNALWPWIESGGQLIVVAENPYIKADSHLDDELLDRLGLSLETDSYFGHWGEDEDDESEEEESETSEKDLKQPNNQADDSEASSTAEETELDHCSWLPVAELTLSGSPPPLEVVVSNSTRLYTFNESAPEVLIPHEDDYLSLARVKVGDGEILVYATDDSLINDHIDCFDNGFAFWQWVKDRDNVWFVANADSPSFWSELWRLSATACIALLLALAFWVWQQGIRFGPIHAIDRSQRRHFMDHIRASATFLLRNDDNSSLIGPLRQEILQKMQVKHTHFNQLNEQQKLEKFQHISNMPSEDIQLAMFHPLPLPAGSLVDAVRRLQHLRNSL